MEVGFKIGWIWDSASPRPLDHFSIILSMRGRVGFRILFDSFVAAFRQRRETDGLI
jgi:hypothetical protein